LLAFPLRRVDLDVIVAVDPTTRDEAVLHALKCGIVHATGRIAGLRLILVATEHREQRLLALHADLAFGAREDADARLGESHDGGADLEHVTTEPRLLGDDEDLELPGLGIVEHPVALAELR